MRSSELAVSVWVLPLYTSVTVLSFSYLLNRLLIPVYQTNSHFVNLFMLSVMCAFGARHDDPWWPCSWPTNSLRGQRSIPALSCIQPDVYQPSSYWTRYEPIIVECFVAYFLLVMVQASHITAFYSLHLIRSFASFWLVTVQSGLSNHSTVLHLNIFNSNTVVL